MQLNQLIGTKPPISDFDRAEIPAITLARQHYMAYSSRSDLYRSPNLAIMGTQIPEYLRRYRPPYIDHPPIIPPPNPDDPFGVPPRIHDVDPPERNPYNDPIFSPFIVTEERTGRTKAEPRSGGLLGSFNVRSNPPEDDMQGGLLGRMLALSAEQARYQPLLNDSERAPAAPGNPDFRQLTRVESGVPVAVNPELITPQALADQAQQARELAAARLARGTRSVARAEGPPPDPVDVAKSAGIGLANGAVNALGMVGDVPTGFGYFPNNLIINAARRKFGFSELPPDAPDWIRDRFSAPAIQRGIEGVTGEFYQPKTRYGRYAEAIGEMAPMVAVGELAAAKSAGAALRGLPGMLAKHAVAPGVAIQALEEAFPDSKAGQALQKAYPLLRRGVPFALAAKRYFSRPIPPQ